MRLFTFFKIKSPTLVCWVRSEPCCGFKGGVALFSAKLFPLETGGGGLQLRSYPIIVCLHRMCIAFHCLQSCFLCIGLGRCAMLLKSRLLHVTAVVYRAPQMSIIAPFPWRSYYLRPPSVACVLSQAPSVACVLSQAPLRGVRLVAGPLPWRASCLRPPPVACVLSQAPFRGVRLVCGPPFFFVPFPCIVLALLCCRAPFHS